MRKTAARSRSRALTRRTREIVERGAARHCLTEHEAQERCVRPLATVVRGEAREVEELLRRRSVDEQRSGINAGGRGDPERRFREPVHERLSFS